MSLFLRQSQMPISTHMTIFNLIMVTWQLFPPGYVFTSLLASAFNFSIFVTQLFHSVSTCPNRKDPVNQLAMPANSLHSNRLKAVLVLSSLITYHNIFFECFTAPVYSPLFQTWFSRLISCQLATFLKDRSVTQVSHTSLALSISPAVQIAYRIRVLEAISTVKHKWSGLWD